MVPCASVGFSNTPIGPFQTTVLALLTASAKSLRVSSPMSRPSMSSGMAFAATVFTAMSASIGFGKSAAMTVSTGSSSLTPLASALAIMSRQ